MPEGKDDALAKAPPPCLAALGEAVNIIVGAEKKRFLIHKDIICHHSEYFRVAFNGEWKEADDKDVVLEDVDAGMFGIFVSWLYTSKLPYGSDWLAAYRNCNKTSPVSNFGILILNACVLGERLLAQKFSQEAHNYYIDLRSPSGYDEVIYAYKNLPEDSSILQMMVDTQCTYWDRHDSKEDQSLHSQLPHKFLFDVMVRFSEVRDWIPARYKKYRRETCEYHIHVTDEEHQNCPYNRFVL
ncbi:hypothetical protein P280DRAFT_522630 [Massarina eburnea CBS 473.64]|uniref:BTB domain-containing protein n=1 Tax=Massarina eburnea CBS 473.64 TaxID=1395130 RepID=A0A6A6RKZ6_9PLEO|nr:hypothetical protein P280DRAFT_522630 [Massarina eburnea CBS 473.64]